LPIRGGDNNRRSYYRCGGEGPNCQGKAAYFGV